MAATSVTITSPSFRAGTLPMGLMARKAGLRWSPALRFSTSRLNGSPSSSSIQWTIEEREGAA